MSEKKTRIQLTDEELKAYADFKAQKTAREHQELAKYGKRLKLILQTNEVLFLMTGLRSRKTGRLQFRQLTGRISEILIEYMLADLPICPELVETPLGLKYWGVRPLGKIATVPILRAGLFMIYAVLKTCPNIRLGFMLIQRDEQTAKPRSMYDKQPNLKGRTLLLLDPMLATGGSARKAIDQLIHDHEVDEEDIFFVNIVCCPEGLEAVFKGYSKDHHRDSCH